MANGLYLVTVSEPGVNFTLGPVGAIVNTIYTIYPTNLTTGGSISCSPNPALAMTDSSCLITPSLSYHVSDVSVGHHGSLLTLVGPLWTYSFRDVTEDKDIQASFAQNYIWLCYNGTPLQTIQTTISDALTQAALSGDDEIRVDSGAFLEGAGLTCSSNFGGPVTLSGGWYNAWTIDTKPTVISPKITISSSCSLIIDEITIE